MSAIYRRKGSKLYQIKVPTRHAGGWINRSTGTANKHVAVAMAKMLDDIGPRGKRLVLFLDAIHNNTLAVGDLYDAYNAGPASLDALRDRMLEVDVEPLIEKWLLSVRGRVAADTIKHYRKHVRTFIPVSVRCPSSQLRRATLRAWFDGIEAKPGTKRKYHAAMSQFCQYLIDLEILAANPMRSIRPPAPAAPRTEYLENDRVIQLVDSQLEQYRTLSALIHGTGMEVSVAVGLKKRDVEKTKNGGWAIVARGTKTASRTRRVYVDTWAVPYLEARIAMLTPDADLFPNVDRWRASDSHREACERLGILNYTLRDARHTWAVRATRAGASPEVVRRQLGHANTLMVNKVYAPFRPNEEEMTGWHDRAAQQDTKHGTG